MYEVEVLFSRVDRVATAPWTVSAATAGGEPPSRSLARLSLGGWSSLTGNPCWEASEVTLEDSCEVALLKASVGSGCIKRVAVGWESLELNQCSWDSSRWFV